VREVVMSSLIIPISLLLSALFVFVVVLTFLLILRIYSEKMTITNRLNRIQKRTKGRVLNCPFKFYSLLTNGEYIKIFETIDTRAIEYLIDYFEKNHFGEYNFQPTFKISYADKYLTTQEAREVLNE
jgi:hypothetical protein